MRLYVCVLEARDLPAPPDRHGHGDGGGFYARVKVGRQRARTRAVELAGPGGAAAWNEEFAFAVGEEDEVVEVGVARRREEGTGREVLGRVKLPLPPVQAASAASGRHSVPPTWFTLHPKHRRKGRAADAADCGACTHFASLRLCLAKLYLVSPFLCCNFGKFLLELVGARGRLLGEATRIVYPCQMPHASSQAMSMLLRNEKSVPIIASHSKVSPPRAYRRRSVMSLSRMRHERDGRLTASLSSGMCSGDRIITH